MSYNKETDYQAKINEAVKAGDYESAAKYEQSRNEKIDKENLGYEKTNRYSGWLDKTDYSNVIRDQISSGASRDDVSKTLKKRVQKASGTEGLTQYAHDDVYDMAVKYIMGSGGYSFSEKKPEYKNSYDNELKRLYNKLSNIGEFRYNPYEDDLYEYYRKQYIREGKRAMEDLLGELSANTGGVISSYAASAASQGMDYYNSKLTDIIPELYNDAYDRYLDSIDLYERDFERLKDLSDSEYEKYLDSVDIYQKNREFDYKKLRDTIEDEAEKEKNDSEYEQLLRELAIEEEQQAYKNALEKWKAMGYLDSESAKILNLPAGLHTTDYDYKKAQQYKLYK